MAEAVRERDSQDRFTLLVIPEIDVLLRVALTLVSRPADGDDLVQETLIRAFRSIDSFDGAHPRAWLLTIMRNAHTNQHRRRRPSLLSNGELTLEPATPAADVAIDQMMDEAVEASVRQLSGRHRAVIDWWTSAG